MKRRILVLGMLLILVGGMVGCSMAKAEIPSEPGNSEIRAGQYFLGDIPRNTIGGASVIFPSPMSDMPVVVLTVRSSNTVSQNSGYGLGISQLPDSPFPISLSQTTH